MEENILICEDSLEGIFTAVYEAYGRHLLVEDTYVQTDRAADGRLFAVYYRVDTQWEKAQKVYRTVRKRFGEEGFLSICRAAASCGEGKASAVYRTIAAGLELERPVRVFERHADPFVGELLSLARTVQNEAHHLKGFLRFQELENGVLFAGIGPKNNVLTFLADHFSDRLPGENFVIFDTGRKAFALHPAGGGWYLAKGSELEQLCGMKYTEKEMLCQELFRCFCHKIAIKERENRALQNQMMPLRFQDFMVEFTQK